MGSLLLTNTPFSITHLYRMEKVTSVKEKYKSAEKKTVMIKSIEGKFPVRIIEKFTILV